jgi:hypothetical protein
LPSVSPGVAWNDDSIALEADTGKVDKKRTTVPIIEQFYHPNVLSRLSAVRNIQLNFNKFSILPLFYCLWYRPCKNHTPYFQGYQSVKHPQEKGMIKKSYTIQSADYSFGLSKLT